MRKKIDGITAGLLKIVEGFIVQMADLVVLVIQHVAKWLGLDWLSDMLKKFLAGGGFVALFRKGFSLDMWKEFGENLKNQWNEWMAEIKEWFLGLWTSFDEFRNNIVNKFNELKDVFTNAGY